MTILIFVLIAFGILNIIHHITMIEQLKTVKEQLKAIRQTQFDLTECLGTIDCDMITFDDKLKDIKHSITSISSTLKIRICNQ